MIVSNCNLYIQHFEVYLKDGDDLECENGLQMTDIKNRDDCDMEAPLNYLLIIILFEIIGIAIVLAKFIQDWVTYKTTGRLPWISRHIPNWYPAFPSDLTSSQQKKKIKNRNHNDNTRDTVSSEQ